MPLSHDQLNQLRNDLLELADVTYAEVMDELLDHYASLTEQSMSDGLSFVDASRKAWVSLGSGQGIHHIQERYKKLLIQQIKRQHWAIVGTYFRWPTLVTTVLIGVLTYLSASIFPPGGMPIFFLIVSFIPYLLVIPSELRFQWRTRIRKQALLRSLRQEVVYQQTRYSNQLNFFVIQLPASIMLFVRSDRSQPFNYPYLFELHAGLSSALTFVAILYAITFIELYQKKSGSQITT